MKMKQILTAALAASLALLALAGCGGKTASSGEAAAKDYAQIIHDARDEEMNDSLMIIAPDAEGGFTALGGGAEEMSADDIKAQAENFILPMLGLEAGDYEDFAASVSIMNVRSYGIAIVKPAEGKAEAVQEALENYASPASSWPCRTTWPTSTRSPRPPPSPPSPRARWFWSAARIRTPSSPPSKQPSPPERSLCSPHNNSFALFAKSPTRTTCAYGWDTYREMERWECARPQGRVRGSALHFVPRGILGGRNF